MASLFSFGSKSSDRIAISFDGGANRPTKRTGTGPTEVVLPIFDNKEPFTGSVEVRVDPGKKLEHMGIKIEMVGQTEMFYDRGNYSEFVQTVRELAPAGLLANTQQFSFDFSNKEKEFESYNGLNVRLRYFIRVTIARNYQSNYVKEQDFIVQIVSPPPDAVVPIKMEVGIEECLHIEFEYDKKFYHLKDIIIGKVFFLLVRIKIKHMEVNIIRREQAGSAGAQQYNESETLTKFEVMDGAPVRGECIPIRLFISSLEVTPTYKSINKKFSVKYYLNLVLVDQEDRRYFKQQEVIMWRNQVG
uniref:Vacuolar protein sorting-associated protein 26 n=1 Tax=Octactis speculum TaxID=3111310 RepID=A0A7S2C2A7_9STRA|mmetsp:Transcript_30832/g.41737  ORF Transcript_30832/g.41737 Transcript_30832/m.41737 type:complete len:302 (+) Transcript_30832:26-931(+)